MAKGFKKMFATVFVENGHHKVMLPSGEVLPHIVETITTDDVEQSKVTITIACNVVTDKATALDGYKD